jgi:hypothetical protein
MQFPFYKTLIPMKGFSKIGAQCIQEAVGFIKILLGLPEEQHAPGDVLYLQVDAEYLESSLDQVNDWAGNSALLWPYRFQGKYNFSDMLRRKDTSGEVGGFFSNPYNTQRGYDLKKFPRTRAW